MGKQRINTRVAVYLIGTRDETLLLGKRQNTGHMDGCWSLVAGHVREGESSSKAIMREVQEEVGINLKPHEIELIGAMHHHSPPYDYIHFVFHADLRSHQPYNKEQHKCGALMFHDINALPAPMNPYILQIIQKSIPKCGLWVTEYGWGQK